MWSYAVVKALSSLLTAYEFNCLQLPSTCCSLELSYSETWPGIELSCGSQDEATMLHACLATGCCFNACPLFVLNIVQDMASLQQLMAVRPRPAEKHG